ncbi:MAG TPA: phosphatase PAP2 family protein [Anaerolineaceae bacterium]|jgi:membrane-associated phospholipid phosphatase
MDRDEAEQAPLDESFPPVETGRRGFSRSQRRALTLGLLTLTLGVFLYLLPVGTRMALVTSIFAQRTVVTVLLLFALVTMSLLWSTGQRLDAWLFLYVNLRSRHSDWLDAVMWLSTQLGSFGFALLVAVTLLLVRLRRVAIVLLLGMLTLWLMVETVKALTDRSRPFNLLEDVRVVGWKALGLSFPSGHTSQAFFLATLISRHFQLGLGITVGLYLLALFVGLTRIYVGAHYPRDVLAGALLGSVWGVLAVIVDAYLLRLASPLP